MSLGIYSSADSSSVFSSDQTFTKPVIFSFDGVSGGTRIIQMYIRNDDITKYYTGIELTPITESGQDIINGSDGFSWKLIEGSSQPTEENWLIVSDGNTISFSNIGSSGNGDDSTYLPFWVRVTIPRNVSIQSFENVKLRITATENNA